LLEFLEKIPELWTHGSWVMALGTQGGSICIWKTERKRLAQHRVVLVLAFGHLRE
jgi:hypothetical protein